MFRILSAILATVGVIALIILATGFFSSPDYEGKTSRFYDHDREIVFEELTRIENIPRDKADVKQVAIIDRDENLITWREDLENGGFRTFKMLILDYPRRYLIEMTDSYNGVTGTWDFRLEEADKMTIVNVVELSHTEDLWTRGIHTFGGRNIISRKILKDLEGSLLQRFIKDV